MKKKDGKSRKFLLMVHQVKMSFKEKLFCLMSEKQYLKITRNISANQKESSWSRCDVTGCFCEITEEEEHFSE